MMTVKEAAALGGAIGGAKLVATRGREYMRQIGARGGANTPTKFKAGDPAVVEIARQGGVVSGGNFARDPERAKAAGRKGGLARAAKYQKRAT